MERSNEVFEDLMPDPKQPSLDEYYKKFKSSFRRVWANKFLWFWGMFLPGSLGVGFNVDEQFAKLNSRKAIDWQNFIENNFNYISLFLLLFFILCIFIWCISIVSRSGVIQSLACLQNAKNKKKLTCRVVWRNGKKDFKNILLLDFFVGMLILIVFLVLLIPVAIMILMGNQAGAIFLFITLLLFFFFFVVFMNYILQISTIYIVLANVGVFDSLVLSGRLIARNLLEVFKLFCIFFLIGILQGTVFLLIIMAIAPFWDKIVSMWLDLYVSSFLEWSVFSSFLMVFLIIIFLFAKAIFSLWIQDIWIWWVGEIGGNKNETEDEEAIREEGPITLAAVVRKKSPIYSE